MGGKTSQERSERSPLPKPGKKRNKNRHEASLASNLIQNIKRQGQGNLRAAKGMEVPGR